MIRNRRDITTDEYYRLEEKLDGKALYTGAEQWMWGRIIKFGNKETNPNVNVCGCTPGAFSNNGWTIEDGREFNQRDVSRNSRSIILGKDIVKVLFPNSDPIGEEVKVDGHKLTVLGVLESQGAFFGQSQDNYAVMPITTWQSFLEIGEV